MRIGILGASGRLGTKLIELILTSPGLELAAAWVSGGSRFRGQAVSGGIVEYRAPEAAIKSHCDVAIDFSVPSASLEFLNALEDRPLPVVIGTTGFDEQEITMLKNHARRRPILISANFAQGFEAFRMAANEFVARMPSADPSVREVYPSHREQEPSASSRLLAEQLAHARGAAMGFRAPKAPIIVEREATTVDFKEIRFQLGTADVVMSYRVHATSAYAQGALAAADWLASKPRAPALYTLADTLTIE